MYEELLGAWRREGLSPRPGVDARAPRQFADRYHVTLPDDVRRYLEIVDGMDENEYGVSLVRFWPLSEIRPVSVVTDGLPEEPFAGYFLFADFLIWSHAYGTRIVAGQSTEVVSVGDARPIGVARTFQQFLETYISNPDDLHRLV